MRHTPIPKVFALALLALCVQGCLSSSNTRHYTLDMTPSGKAESGVYLNIVRVQPLESLTRPEILIQMSPTQLEYYAEEAWVATLQQLITEKLRRELGEKKPGQPVFDMSVQVSAFQQVDTPGGADALAKLRVEVREEGSSMYDPAVFERDYESRFPAAPDANSIVLALGKALEEIAMQIANDTRHLQAKPE